MAHSRNRFLTPTLQKSLSFWPVITLVGARQVGKSTLLKKFSGYDYITLDDPAVQDLAERNPKAILHPPCAIDEIQKAPRLFDAIKLDVDQEKRPGKYIITGSVRFSKRSLIRESLTGRTKTISLFPFTVAEALQLPFQNMWTAQFPQRPKKPRVSRKDFTRILAGGGMPAIFSVRNSSEITAYWKALIDSYVYRDLLFSVPKNAKPRVALDILHAVAEILALGELPTFSRILRKAGGTRSVVERHLVGLEDLMILHRIPFLGASSAKDIFIPFDSAFFLALLGLKNPLSDAAIHIACIQIRMVSEFLAAQQISDLNYPLFYAESPTGQQAQLITRDANGKYLFFQIFEEAIPHDYQLRFLDSLVKKYEGVAVGLSSIESETSIRKVKILPWESMF